MNLSLYLATWLLCCPLFGFACRTIDNFIRSKIHG